MFYLVLYCHTIYADETEQKPKGLHPNDYLSCSNNRSGNCLRIHACKIPSARLGLLHGSASIKVIQC